MLKFDTHYFLLSLLQQIIKLPGLTPYENTDDPKTQMTVKAPVSNIYLKWFYQTWSAFINIFEVLGEWCQNCHSVVFSFTQGSSVSLPSGKLKLLKKVSIKHVPVIFRNVIFTNFGTRPIYVKSVIFYLRLSVVKWNIEVKIS